MKETVRDLYIEWISDINDMNKTMKFIYHWVKYKIPDIDESRLREFVNKLYHAAMVPSFYEENKAVAAIRYLADTAKIELEVNSIVLTKDYNQILKYY